MRFPCLKCTPFIPFGTGPTPAAALPSHASQKAHTNRALITKGYCIVMRQQHCLQLDLNNRKGQEREIEMY